MIQFQLFRLPDVFAFALLILTPIALLSACGKHDANADNQAADMPGSPPRVSISQAGQDLPRECLEAIAADRACADNFAMKLARVGQVANAKKMRDAMLAHAESKHARWLRAPDREALRPGCIAERDLTPKLPQCQP